MKPPMSVTFHGEPIAGVHPTVLEVRRPLTELQAGQVDHVYKLFCDAARLSLAPYFAQHYKSEDRTMTITITRNQKQDFIEVENTSGADEGAGLPHGFLVQGSWIDPQLLGLPDGGGDIPVWVSPPQSANQIYGTHQLVFHAGAIDAENFRAVQVVGTADNTVWDMVGHKVESTSSGSPKPLPLKTAGVDEEYFWHDPHFGGGASIKNEMGVSVYTMEEPSTIMVDDPLPSYFPAQANAIGTKAVLQGVRFAVFNEVLECFAFRSEVVHRIAPAVPPAGPPVEYVLDQAQSLFMYVPLATAATGSTTNNSDLGETPSNVVGGKKIATGSYSGPARDMTYGNFITRADGGFGTYGWYGVPGEYFNYGYAWEMTTLEPLSLAHASHTTVPYTYRSTTTEAKAAPVTKEFAIALMGISECEYASIEHDISYPRNSYFRNGEEAWTAGLGLSTLTGGAAGWSITNNTIIRRNLTVSVITPVTSTLELVWTDVKILEGNVSSVANLSYYVDTQYREFRETNFAYSIYDRPTIAGFTPGQPADILPPATDGGAGGVYPYIILTPPGTIGVKPFIPVTGDMNPGFADIQAEYTGYMPPVITDSPLTNTVDYSYTTRYIIDYDHKGQFYVAIRVTVACAGAKWREVPSPPWRGASEVETDPTYTVTIKLEVKWKNNALLEQTLYTGSCTRPCFEAIKLRYLNLYYPLGTFKDDPTHDIFVRIAPQLNVPSGLYAQMYNLAYPQDSNDRLVCEDVFTGTEFSNPALASTDTFDYSYGEQFPQKKFRPGVLYHRVFKLSEFSAALYLIGACKMDCTENNLPLYDEEGDPIPGRVPYFYIPTLKECIENEEFNILIKDDAFEDWTVDLIGATDTTVWPNAEKPRPEDPKTWNIKLNRI